MKLRSLTSLSILLIGAVPAGMYAQLTTGFDTGGSNSSNPETVSYTINDAINGTTVSTLEAATPLLTGSLPSTIFGTFSITVTPFVDDFDESVEPPTGTTQFSYNALDGSFTQGLLSSGINVNGSGWGVPGGLSTDGNGINTGESLVLEFDLSGLTGDLVLSGFNPDNASGTLLLVESGDPLSSGGTGIASLLGEGETTDLAFTLSDGDILILANTGGGNARLASLTYTAVPEPSSCALILGLAAIGIIKCRRRRV